jgi:NAD(P)-dependent dehydrogenase (short-subunit alcohol dehydrogenase family)
MSENIKGKVAVITGGTKGIGRAIAESLLQAGANVFVCGRNAQDLRNALTALSEFGRVEGETCDVRSFEQIKMMLNEAERKFGGVDILINNAGMGIFKLVEETKPEEFRQVLETNLFGVFYTCNATIPMMKRRGGGYIINISSLAGTNAHPRMSAYNASKFGLNGFSEALMQEVRHDNIKVSYIMPGSVNTEFGGEAVSDEKSWQLQPADVAQTVLDLLQMPARALPSRVELRPSRPPQK